MMKRLFLVFSFLAILTAVCGVHATVPNPAKAYSFESSKTLVPSSLSGWIICHNDPINLIDPDGRKERKGILAGTVRNNSTKNIFIVAGVNNKPQVAILRPGQSSNEFFTDTDAVIFTPDNPIEGHTEGAYKISTQDIDIEENSDGELYLDLDNTEHTANWVSGRAGVVSADEAMKQGWVIPPTTEEPKQEGQPAGIPVVVEVDPDPKGT